MITRLSSGWLDRVFDFHRLSRRQFLKTFEAMDWITLFTNQFIVLCQFEIVLQEKLVSSSFKYEKYWLAHRFLSVRLGTFIKNPQILQALLNNYKHINILNIFTNAMSQLIMALESFHTTQHKVLGSGWVILMCTNAS